MTAQSDWDMATQHAIYSTANVDRRDRVAFWCDLICDVFVNLDCANTGDDFFGTIQDRHVGQLQLSALESVKHSVIRSKYQIAKTSEDFFLVSMQLTGMGCLEQDGRTAVLGAGDWALYDATRWYKWRFEERFEQLVLKVPRDVLKEGLAFPEQLTARTINGASGMARVALDFVGSVLREAHTLAPHEIEHVSHNVIDVVSAALGHELTAQPVSSTTTKAAQLLRIKSHIVDHLRDAKLNRENIAASNGISVRYLNKLFESETNNITLWIRKQRLDRVARDLSDPKLFGRSISEIAYGWGFNNIPHFCRAFRDRFGRTPREYRTHPDNN